MTRDDWFPQLKAITRSNGFRAGVEFLEGQKALADCDGRRELLVMQSYFAGAGCIDEVSREGKLLLVDRLRSIVGELGSLGYDDPERHRGEMCCALGSLLEGCLHLGPCTEFRAFAVPALEAARSSPFSSPPRLDRIERELQDRLLLRIALVACALGEDRLAGEVLPSVSKEFLAMSAYMIRLLDPFGCRLPA